MSKCSAEDKARGEGDKKDKVDYVLERTRQRNLDKLGR